MRIRLFYTAILILLGIPTERAFAAVPTADRHNYKSATIWSTGKKYIRLGYDGVSEPKLGHATGDYAWVQTPESVFEAAKNILTGNPKAWEVNNIKNFNNSGKRVVVLSDRRLNNLICLAERRQWIRLNDKGGLPAINELLRNHAGRNLVASTMETRIHYLEHVTFLFKGPYRAMLSKSFSDYVKTDLSLWLAGKENRPKELYRLCFDPVVIKNGSDVKVIFNMLPVGGSVERWTIVGSNVKKFTIHDVNVQTIKPPGTFHYFGV